MAQPLTTAGLQDVLGFPFRDPNWKNKFLIGSLLSLSGMLIPIVPLLFIYGYLARIARGIIIDKREPFLPEWDRWEDLLTDGLKVGGAALIYMLPFLVLFVVGYIVMFIPAIFAGVAEASHRSPDAAWGLVSFLGTFVWMIFFGLGMLGMMIVGVILPAALGHLIATNRFQAAFEFRNWWPIFRANLGGFLLTYAIIMGLSFLAGFVVQILYFTIILCCLTPFVMAPLTTYLMSIWSALMAQAYENGVQKRASEVPAA